ncbi:hypothetical protein EIB72_20235 [Burkholderia ambifaria]|uniref:hypothetical protein n=1 Tax=Burkholderia ambifaria TaxID=152480 RepID=UPI0013FD19B6|nr:hypothetical protein [Burkholderia ambifaria]NHL68714.1 hypothetical protein [Burkholderia ambifaria]
MASVGTVEGWQADAQFPIPSQRRHAAAILSEKYRNEIISKIQGRMPPRSGRNEWA